MKDFLLQLQIGVSMRLNTGHYIHYDMAETIAEEARKFLTGIESSSSSKGG